MEIKQENITVGYDLSMMPAQTNSEYPGHEVPRKPSYLNMDRINHEKFADTTGEDSGEPKEGGIASPTEITRFPCDFCDFETTKKSEHKAHIQEAHLNMRKYPCDTCDYRGNTKHVLAKHKENKHKFVKNLQCKHCGYQSRKKTEYEEHLTRVHLGVKQYQCSKCEFFVDCYNWKFQKHMQMCHPPAPPRCNTCDNLAAGKPGWERLMIESECTHIIHEKPKYVQPWEEIKEEEKWQEDKRKDQVKREANAKRAPSYSPEPVRRKRKKKLQPKDGDCKCELQKDFKHSVKKHSDIERWAKDVRTMPTRRAKRHAIYTDEY